MIVTSCIESLIIADHFNPDISSLILNYSLISLKRIEIGNDCFEKVNRVVINGLNELDGVIIGSDSFCLHEKHRYESKCLIMNCNQLNEINIEENSFKYYESFELKNLPSLISIQLDGYAFKNCHLIVFESMNDWMNDEWDLIRLQSITLGEWALCGDCDTVESNELIMKSMSDNDDWLIRSSFFISNRRIWTQFLQCRQSDSGEWWLIIEYDLDIPLLTQNRIYMRWTSVQRLGKDYNVRELYSSSTIDWLIMIEMLILLIDSFDRGVSIYWR